MRIEIPKIVKKIELAEYAPEFGEQVIEVWVNPSKSVFAEFEELQDRVEDLTNKIKAAKNASGDEIHQVTEDSKKLNDDIARWYSAIWSQGENPISPSEVTELLEAAKESDPGFQNWLFDMTWASIREHRDTRKKG